jgi:hypothetical protein
VVFRGYKNEDENVTMIISASECNVSPIELRIVRHPKEIRCRSSVEISLKFFAVSYYVNIKKSVNILRLLKSLLSYISYVNSGSTISHV